MTTAHTTRARSFSAAGDRRWYAHCDTCNRAVGKPTTDKQTAEAEANQHAYAPASVATP